MENIDNFIADYWNDNLSNADKKRFEAECIADENFAKRAALQLELKKTAIRRDKAIRKVEFQQYQIKRKKERRGIIILGILLLGIIMWFSYQMFKSPKELPEPAIYAQQYWNNTDKPNFNSIRGETVDTLNLRIEKEYQKEHFDIILNTLDGLNLSNKADLLLIRAIAYFETEDFENSIKDFQVYLDNNFESIDQAYWLQSLAFMKINQTEKAIKNWKIIIEEDYQHKNDANTLINLFE